MVQVCRGIKKLPPFFVMATVVLTWTDGKTCRAHRRYDEAADAYEEGLKTSPGDAALGRGLEDVLKAQAASKAPAGESCPPWHEKRG